MWEDRGTAHADMIEILISLTVFKLRSRLWSVDHFLEQWCYVIYDLYPLLDDGQMTSTFDFFSMWWCCYYIFSGICYVMFQLLYLIFIVFVESFIAAFSLWRERLKSLSLVLRGTGLGGEPWDQLLVNWFAYRSRHKLWKFISREWHRFSNHIRLIPGDGSRISFWEEV